MDYLTWPEGERYEIIDGIAYMQAAPFFVIDIGPVFAGI